MSRHLIVIDMQNDFCTGSLKNNDAVAIIPFIKEKIAEFRKDGDVIYTRDTHQKDYLQTLEGKHLPVEHCIAGTWGHQIVDELASKPEDIVIDKPTFGYKDWSKIKTIKDGDEIYICGTCTSICVASNIAILKSVFPKSEIYVYRLGTADLNKDLQESTLKVLASQQVNII